MSPIYLVFENYVNPAGHVVTTVFNVCDTRELAEQRRAAHEEASRKEKNPALCYVLTFAVESLKDI